MLSWLPLFISYDVFPITNRFFLFNCVFKVLFFFLILVIFYYLIIKKADIRPVPICTFIKKMFVLNPATLNKSDLLIP